MYGDTSNGISAVRRRGLAQEPRKAPLSGPPPRWEAPPRRWHPAWFFIFIVRPGVPASPDPRNISLTNSRASRAYTYRRVGVNSATSSKRKPRCHACAPAGLTAVLPWAAAAARGQAPACHSGISERAPAHAPRRGAQSPCAGPSLAPGLVVAQGRRSIGAANSSLENRSKCAFP